MDMDTDGVLTGLTCFLVIGMLLSLGASAKMKSTFSVYQRRRSASGLTGAETARRILNAAGIFDVQIVPIEEALPIIMIPGRKWSACPEMYTDRLPWRQWEWRPMSAAMPSSMPEIMLF